MCTVSPNIAFNKLFVSSLTWCRNKSRNYVSYDTIKNVKRLFHALNIHFKTLKYGKNVTNQLWRHCGFSTKKTLQNDVLDLVVELNSMRYLRCRANARKSFSDRPDWQASRLFSCAAVIIRIRNKFLKILKVLLIFVPSIHLNCAQKPICDILFIDNSLHRYKFA